MLTAATVLAIATTVGLRIVDGDWALALIAVLVLLGIRLILSVREVMRGQLPWTRLLLPSIVWIEGIGFAGQGWELRLVTALVLELAFVVAAIRALVRHRSGLVEERIARALEAIVPPPVAKLAAIEMTLVGLAIAFLAGGWRRPVPEGFSYHRENGIRQLLPILPLLGIGDGLLLELVVLPHAATWVRVVVHAVAGYGLIWLVGLYASARARPHRLDGDRLELYRGVLRHITIERCDILAIAPMPAFSDAWKERAYKRASVRLDLGATQVLEVTLRDHRRLLVGVDDAEAFVTVALPTPMARAPSSPNPTKSDQP